MNKGYSLLILIAVCVGGYFALQYFNLLPQVTGPLNNAAAQISGFLEGFNTFIKNNPSFAPILTVCGSLTAAGIVKWFSSRAQAKAVSTLQNESLQVQNNLTQTYQNSVASLQQQVQSLQGQLSNANGQLSSIPNISELQAAYNQQLKEIENYQITLQALQNELTRQKIQVVTVPVVK